MEIPILLLDFNHSNSNNNSNSNSFTTLETLGNVACYKSFLMKETIKLLSLFDDDCDSSSQIRSLKPHIIVGSAGKSSSTFQLFQAGSYTSASMLATLMKVCDLSLPSNSSSSNNSSSSSSSSSNKSLPPPADTMTHYVLDYIIEGLKLGREVASSKKVMNSKLVLFLISTEDFVTQKTPDQSSVSRYSSELAKTKCGTTYISNKYINSIALNMFICSTAALNDDADPSVTTTALSYMSLSLDHVNQRLDHLKSILLNTVVTMNLDVIMSTLFPTAVYFEEIFREIRSEIFHFRPSSIVFSQQLSGLRCELNVDLFPMSLNSLKYKTSIDHLEIVCLIPSDFLPCSFIEGNAFIVQASAGEDNFDKRGGGGGSEGLKKKSKLLDKQNKMSFQCFCQSLGEINSIAIVATQSDDKMEREVWALVPPQPPVKGTLPLDLSAAAAVGGGEGYAISDYQMYNKMTLIRLVNRDTLLNPKVLSSSVEINEDDGISAVDVERSELTSFFKELLASATVTSTFNPLVFVSGGLNLKLLQLMDNHSNSSNSSSCASANANSNNIAYSSSTKKVVSAQSISNSDRAKENNKNSSNKSNSNSNSNSNSHSNSKSHNTSNNNNTSNLLEKRAVQKIDQTTTSNKKQRKYGGNAPNNQAATTKQIEIVTSSCSSTNSKCGTGGGGRAQSGGGGSGGGHGFEDVDPGFWS